MKLKLYSVILVLSFLPLLVTVSSAPVYDDNDEFNLGTSLKIKKWIEGEQIVSIGETITVHVNVTNVGKLTAHNLTVIEPLFSNYTVDTLNSYTPHNWVTVFSKGTFSYSYSFSFRKLGVYYIESTRITSRDSNQVSYEAFSNHIQIDVVENPSIRFTAFEWLYISLLCIGIVSLPIFVFIINSLVFRRKNS